MLEATARLKQSGYKVNLTALPGARIHCGACNNVADAHEATVDETVRFEGDSNPADDGEVLRAIADTTR